MKSKLCSVLSRHLIKFDIADFPKIVHFVYVRGFGRRRPEFLHFFQYRRELSTKKEKNCKIGDEASASTYYAENAHHHPDMMDMVDEIKCNGTYLLLRYQKI